MKKPISFKKIEVELASTMEEPGGKLEPETPFRILIMGDFSGRANRGLASGAARIRNPVLVDRDNFDEVLGKLGVEIHLPMGKKAPPLKLRFRELEDFHPTNSSNGCNRWKRCGMPGGSWPTPGLLRPPQRHWGPVGAKLPRKGKSLPPRNPRRFRDPQPGKWPG